MTFSAGSGKTSYAGDGSTTSFPTTFKFTLGSHVKAIVRDANGIETTWVEATNYTLTGAGNDAGGTLTATIAPASGETLVIILDVPFTQEKAFPLGGSFPSTQVEEMGDLNSMQSAKLSEVDNRTLKVPETDTQVGSSLDIPIDSVRAGKFLAFDTNGKPIVAAGTSADLGPVSSFINDLLDDADDATARGTLKAAGTEGNETIAGNKTFADDSTFTGEFNADGPFALGDGSELTISNGSITPTGNFHLVDTEADGSTDDLTDIDFANIPNGGLVLLQPANDDRTVVVKHNASKIVTADNKDLNLDDIEDFVLVKRRGAIGEEICRSSPVFPAGSVIQKRAASTTTEFSITTQIPFDTTTPQDTEGDEIITQSITPKFSNSKLLVSVFVGLANEGGGAFISAALFKDTNANAEFAALFHDVGTGSGNGSKTLQFLLDAVDTATRTYKLRVGPGNATTVHLNRSGTSNTFGTDKVQTIMMIEEIAQ